MSVAPKRYQQPTTTTTKYQQHDEYDDDKDEWYFNNNRTNWYQNETRNPDQGKKGDVVSQLLNMVNVFTPEQKKQIKPILDSFLKNVSDYFKSFYGKKNRY